MIQPVPVYSQYMSISPDSSAFRAATDPARPIWSFTVAPAFSRTCSVIWPRINCSVNSLEPTVKSASGEVYVPRCSPPPPPQPATIRARTARSPSSCSRALHVSFAQRSSLGSCVVESFTMVHGYRPLGRKMSSATPASQSTDRARMAVSPLAVTSTTVRSQPDGVVDHSPARRRL